MMKIQIPKPCHEDWGKMSTEAQGRFCTSCQKVVVDFTHMSDDEVKNYLLKNRQQKTCGRFLVSQIDRPLANKTIILSHTWYAQLPYARQVFYAVALFFVLGVSACNWENSRQEKTEPQKLETIMGICPPPEHFNPLIKDTVLFVPPNRPKVKRAYKMEAAPIKEAMGAPIMQDYDTANTLETINGKIAFDTVVLKTEAHIIGFTAAERLEDTSKGK